VLSQQLLTRRSPFQTERSHFRSVKGRQDGKTVGVDERHPPVARADMATVGTSMSDGQCHEVGHQAEPIAIAEMAAEGRTKKVVVPIRMNGAIVTIETLSIVDGVMMEDKVKATGIHVSVTIDARNATCASSAAAMRAMRAIRGWTTLRLVEGITSQGIGIMKIDVEMSDNVLTVESSRIGVLLLEMCTTGARRHQSAKEAEEEMISTQVNGRKFQWAGTRSL